MWQRILWAFQVLVFGAAFVMGVIILVVASTQDGTVLQVANGIVLVLLGLVRGGFLILRGSKHHQNRSFS